MTIRSEDACVITGGVDTHAGTQVAAALDPLGGLLFELSGGTFRVKLHDVLASDEHAAALFTIGAERAGRQLNDKMVQTYHVRDGKVAETWSYQTVLYAVDEFWS